MPPHPALARRDLGLAALALGTTMVVGARPAAARGIPPSGVMPFTARRSEGDLGYHQVRFSRSGDRLTVDTEIMLRVRFGFITVFRYTQENREIWVDGRLISMESRTDDNGDRFEVSARAAEDGLRVTGSGGDYIAPADTIPGSYWNIAMLDRPEVLHTQNGELTPIDTRFLGRQTVAAGPPPNPARHHRIIGHQYVL